jgi:hypothetical protein
MNRIRLLLFTMFVVAVTVLTSGISLTYAQGPAVEKDPAAAKKAAEKDPAIAKKKADAAARALAKRAEFLKQRKESREYIKKVIEGQQPRPASPAPDNTGTGGAK